MNSKVIRLDVRSATMEKFGEDGDRLIEGIEDNSVTYAQIVGTLDLIKARRIKEATEESGGYKQTD